MADKKKLHDQIVEVLKKYPNGLSIHELREKLPSDIGAQAELNKRVRELRYKHAIPYENGKYYYRGKRSVPLDNQGINSKLRAAVLNMAHGRCQMCGRTVAEDGIKLEVDHKVPHNWGGPTAIENLWAICSLCNSGKRDFFKSFDDEEMKKLVAIENVHARLAEVLRLHQGSPVPSWFLEFVANVNDFQEDWQRRLRELRSLGIEYSFKKTKLPSGKVQTTYKLEKWKDLPANPRAEIKRVESGVD
ncbi:MAG: HNH endonuclease [Proteobacteria bacterium]|nr:HNH endonuclease [Pseudomonadota bacterium]